MSRVLQCVTVRLSRVLPNTSTLVPNERSQCHCSVLPVMQCALVAHLDVGVDIAHLDVGLAK